MALSATNSDLVMHTSSVRQDGPPCDAKAGSSHDLPSVGHSPTLLHRFAIVSHLSSWGVWCLARCFALLVIEVKALIRTAIYICYEFATSSRRRFSQVIDFIMSGQWGDCMADYDATLSEQQQVPAQFSRGWPINPQGHTLAALLAEVEDAPRYDVCGLTQEGEAYV